MRTRPSLTFAALAALALAAPSLALAQEERNRFRIQAVSVDPSGSLDEGGLAAEVDRGSGIRLAWERIWNGRFGLELGAAFSSHETSASLGGVDLAAGDLAVVPLTAAFNFHPWPERKLDLFVGAGLAAIDYGDVEFELPGSAPSEVSAATDLTWLIQAGLEFPIGPQYGLSLAVQYLGAEAELELDGSPVLPVEPIVIAFGLTVRY